MSMPISPPHQCPPFGRQCHPSKERYSTASGDLGEPLLVNDHFDGSGRSNYLTSGSGRIDCRELKFGGRNAQYV